MSVVTKQIKQRFGIIGTSPLLEHAINVAVQVAPTDMSVLIIGESGVGKESFPKIIHQNSRRKHGPYIAVNCGAIPEGTIDSELFGHLKGSFTGAMSDRKGYFQEANEGTIFLDEVGELPLPTQARLLRVLETGEFIPVGSSQPIKTDVRIVAATNVNLHEAVQRGRFREDLLFRLNTVPIELPPLRRRKEDVGLLFRYFASLSADKYQMPAIRLEPEAVRLLEEYHWPGNIRELRNLVDRISILEEERSISLKVVERYLPQAMRADYRPALRSYDQYDGQGGDSPFLEALLEMRKEITELRGLVMSLLHGGVPPSGYHQSDAVAGATSYALPSPTDGSAYGAGVRSYKALPTSSPTATEYVEVHEVQAKAEDTPIMTLDQMERDLIQASLKRHQGRRAAVAKELQISERTLYRKIKDYDLEA